MNVTIKKSNPAGTVSAPPSKSMAHRLLICAGLCRKKSVIHGVAPSQDVLATLDCLAAVGADISYEGDTVTIVGADIENINSIPTLPCRECGSTLRFFIPICLLSKTESTLIGSERLMERPLTVYEDLCKKNGLKFEKNKNELRVCGRLTSGNYQIPGNISSQFISGLLFALPLTDGDSRIEITDKIESRSYIDMTINALACFGVDAVWESENTLYIKGNQEYRPCNITVEGDYSNAAFFSALNFMGGNVNVINLPENSAQGDKIYEKYFDILASDKYMSELDISDCPDLGPVLFAVSAANRGGRFIGTKRLKIKESDRGLAMAEELAKFGVSVEVGEDIITVIPHELHTPKQPLCGHNDHRIVMALAVLAVKTGGTILGAEAVSKSLPDFFEMLASLDVEIIKNEA